MAQKVKQLGARRLVIHPGFMEELVEICDRWEEDLKDPQLVSAHFLAVACGLVKRYVPPAGQKKMIQHMADLCFAGIEDAAKEAEKNGN